MRNQRLISPRLFLAVALLGLFGTDRVYAGFITYLATVDTSALDGEHGYLDIEFNPGGLGAASATATLANFSPAANQNPSDLNNSVSGDVSGSLAGTLIFDNGTAYNDYFEGFTYGNSIDFDVTLSGPAVNNSGTSLYGSSFAFSLYDSTGMVPLLTTDPNGSVLTINVNADGTTSVKTFAQSSTDNSPVASAAPLQSTVPAPPSILLLITARRPFSLCFAPIGFGAFFRLYCASKGDPS